MYGIRRLSMVLITLVSHSHFSLNVHSCSAILSYYHFVVNRIPQMGIYLVYSMTVDGEIMS